jgi:hypothetical protein
LISNPPDVELALLSKDARGDVAVIKTRWDAAAASTAGRAGA